VLTHELGCQSSFMYGIIIKRKSEHCQSIKMLVRQTMLGLPINGKFHNTALEQHPLN